jgi:hypothetical protein
MRSAPAQNPQADARNAARMGVANALGAAQQDLLSLGRSIGQSYQAASDKRVAMYAYHLPINPEPVSSQDLYSTRKVTFPLSGTVVIAALGDAVLSESEGFLSECFIPLDGGEAKQIGGHVHTIQPNELTCKLKQNDAAYTPLYNNYSSSAGAMSMGQTLKLKDEAYQLCYRNMGMNAMCVKNIPRDRVVETVGIVELKNTARDIAIFKGAADGKLSIGLDDGGAGGSGKALTFDMNSSRSVEINGVSFDVLEYSENQVVLRRK